MTDVKQELADLRLELEKLRQTMDEDFAEITHHLKTIYGHIEEIHRCDLPAKVKKLRAEVADIGQAWHKESDNTTKHLGSIYRHISDLQLHVKPILYKFFPHYKDKQ